MHTPDFRGHELRHRAAVDPFTDGLMILRFMLGMNGAAMTQGAIGSSPTRTVSEMTTYMQNITPVTPAP